MSDIAADLGVSLMTVSKALRNHSDISEATRKRVLKRARELNYEPNWIARSLATKRSYLIGLIIPDLMHSFFAEIAKGVSRKLEGQGYQMVIANSAENPESESRQVGQLLAQNVGGLIIASAQASGRSPQFRLLLNRKCPFVLIDRLPKGLDTHYVGCPDEEIGALATSHLVAQGRRRIAHIRGPALSTGVGRLRGYRRALADAGLEAAPEYVVAAQFTDDAGYRAMRQLLALPQPPDGVFCCNDPVAAGAIRAALEAGLSVPGDVAIVGSGNVHYSDVLRVPLTTIDQGSAAIGEKAAELLIECLDSKTPLPPRQILIKPQLVVRDSTR